MNPVTLSRDEARRLLVAHLGLARTCGRGARGTRAVLERLRCIQLDPLDVIGTNADLVVMARTDDVARGDVWTHLFPEHAFEHFAKERCILPADSFPHYRAQGHGAQTHWWKHSERESRVPRPLIDAVLAEVAERGPVSARDLTDHGSVVPLDWAGWMGTSKATTMALEILWTQCDVVVAGRTESGAKLYDIPSRALGPAASKKPDGDFARWALLERAAAAGLLSRAGGATWSMLAPVRKTSLLDDLIAEGALVDVRVEDSPRPYVATPAFLRTRKPRYDDRVRILGPLDPLLWDRELVRHAFDFEYIWEVYKPAPQRRWGWYVTPLLFRDTFVGRVEARVERGALRVHKLWIESPEADRALIAGALERHAARCGAGRLVWSPSAKRTMRA